MEIFLSYAAPYFIKAMTFLLFLDKPDSYDVFTDEKMQQYTGVLICSNSLFYLFFRYTFYNICICLAYDLVKTVRDPFESGDVRYLRLLPLSFTFFGILLAWWIGQATFAGLGNENYTVLGYNNPPCSAYVFRNSKVTLDMLFETVFMFYTIIAILMASSGLCRKGMNKEVRMRIFTH